MFNNNDVITDVRKLAGSKPVCAAAGAGVLASQALREVPGKLARWRDEAVAAPSPVTEWPGRVAGYARSARVKAAERYDRLADRGREVLHQHDGTGKSALNGAAPASDLATSEGAASQAAAGDAALTEAATGEAATAKADTAEAGTTKGATGDAATAKAAVTRAGTGKAATSKAATSKAATGKAARRERTDS